jgi:hypothetical protein
MLDSINVDVPGLDANDNIAPVSDPLLKACDVERFGTWTFHTLVRGIEWDPALFTRIVLECEPKLKPTLEKASIFTYACQKPSQTTPVPHGYFPVEGYLKMHGNNTVMCSTLKRRLQHPDLQNPENPSRSWAVEWTACRVGRRGRYTDHDFIMRRPCRQRRRRCRLRHRQRCGRLCRRGAQCLCIACSCSSICESNVFCWSTTTVFDFI